LRLQPLNKSRGTATQQKTRMKDHERQWKKQCILTEQKLEMMMPMLERLFADDHIADFGKETAPPAPSPAPAS
jgi:hypothetical protein